MLKIARIAIKKNAAFSDCIVVFGVKPYIAQMLIIISEKEIIQKKILELVLIVGKEQQATIPFTQQSTLTPQVKGLSNFDFYL